MDLHSELTRLWQERLAAGESPQRLLEQFLAVAGSSSTLTADTGATRLDLDRQRRCGHPEVIFGQGKTVAGLLEIVARQAEAGQDVLVTRVSPEQATAVVEAHRAAVWNSVGRTLRWMRLEGSRPTCGHVAVVTAGTSDRPVAEEAVETLAWMRVGHELITDVGVAGPWRLLEQLPRLAEADAVIVIAGMEGALPSVVGGWVACPVIAVPTSVGYGAALGGLTALLGMLNSCAANVTVVNIDAGFKAGYVAGLIARASG
jgi:NCAIR mutase (PurE)-related protein